MSALDGELDGATLEGLRRRDPHALAECFRTFGKRTYRLARGILGQGADAEDATQEVFLRVREKAASFDGQRSFAAWLRRLAVNHCLNRLEEKRRRDARVDLRDPDLVPVRSQADFETAESLERALATLPDEQRAVLVLREIEGLTYREIAESLSIPIGTVMSRLARARERLVLELGIVPSMEVNRASVRA